MTVTREATMRAYLTETRRSPAAAQVPRLLRRFVPQSDPVAPAIRMFTPPGVQPGDFVVAVTQTDDDRDVQITTHPGGSDDVMTRAPQAAVFGQREHVRIWTGIVPGRVPDEWAFAFPTSRVQVVTLVFSYIDGKADQ